MNRGDDDGRALSRREVLRRWTALAAVPAAMGVWGTCVEPFWVDEHEVPVVMTHLPPAFQGLRIAHLSDLHAHVNIPMEYLRGVVRRTNALRPDVVAITGDFTTHNPNYIETIAEIVGELRAPVYASLGNHDYGLISAYPGMSTYWAGRLEAALVAKGVTVLRNASVTLRRGSDRLHIVGLEDVHTGLFDPAVAFRGVPRTEAIVAMSHNPDSVPFVDGYCCGLILSGHTHGGQVRLPLVGAPVLPVSNREFDQGLFRLKWSQLFVSRGVGYLKRIRFACRPELPVIVLRSSATNA